MINKKVSFLIIQNQKGDFLLIMRDNKETIPYPNYWSLIGGTAENSEIAEQTLIREVK